MTNTSQDLVSATFACVSRNTFVIETRETEAPQGSINTPTEPAPTNTYACRGPKPSQTDLSGLEHVASDPALPPRQGLVAGVTLGGALSGCSEEGDFQQTNAFRGLLASAGESEGSKPRVSFRISTQASKATRLNGKVEGKRGGWLCPALLRCNALFIDHDKNRKMRTWEEPARTPRANSV